MQMMAGRDKNIEQLLLRIRQGDPSAEQELFAHYCTRIVRKIRISVGIANEDWKDILSEVQIALLYSLRDGQFDISKSDNLGSYVYGITMKKIYNYFKSKKQQNVLPINADNIYEPTADILELYEQQELRDGIRSLLKRLKIKYKKVLYLRYYEGYSVAEIGQLLSLPSRRVSERLHYALKLLKKECRKEKIFQYFLIF